MRRVHRVKKGVQIWIMPKRLLTMNQVLERVPVSRQQIYAWISKGSFPRQIRLSENRVAWLEADIEEWIDGMIEATVEKRTKKSMARPQTGDRP